MREFNIKLNETSLNIILAALVERPWKDVNETVQMLLQQVNEPPKAELNKD